MNDPPSMGQACNAEVEPAGETPQGSGGAVEREEGPLRVLVVDDQDNIHEDFKLILGRNTRDEELAQAVALVLDDSEGPSASSAYDNNFTLSHARQGDEAVDLVRASLAIGERFALAYVDMRMPPGMSGVETIEAIWAVDPEVEVVVCSAYSDHDARALMERLGRPQQLLIVRKPFDPDEILQSAIALTARWRTKLATARELADMHDRIGAFSSEIASVEAKLVRLQHAPSPASRKLLNNMRERLGAPIVELLALTCRLRALALPGDAGKLSEEVYDRSQGLLSSVADIVRDHDNPTTNR